MTTPTTLRFLKQVLRRRLPHSRRAQMMLSPSERRAYASEAEENFRWLSSFVATTSTRVLTSSDLMDDQVYSELSAIGQYAEMAHGSISPSFVFQHLEELCMPGQPLEDYGLLMLEGAQLVKDFRGQVAGVQGYVAFRAASRQLVLAFSGTSSPAQAFKDMQTWRVTYPRDAERSTVHGGFYEMYRGVRSSTYEALRLGLQSHGNEINGIVLTGHSMGSTMCYLLALDLITEVQTEESVLPRGITINLAVFGSPRIGNEGLAKYWRRCVEDYTQQFGEDSFVEYSVKGFQDGVSSLPPCFLGFRHLTKTPLYLYQGRLYRIPSLESEHGAFTVKTSPEPQDPAANSYLSHQAPVVWLRGGHNYYNGRDMEKLQRRMRWLELTVYGENGWQERYASRLRGWEAKWGKDVEE